MRIFEIKNWVRIQGRNDVLTPWWFKLEIEVISRPEFVALSDGEFRCWVYALCECARQKKGRFHLVEDHLVRICGLSLKNFDSMVRTLSKIGSIAEVLSDPSRSRPDPVHDLSRTRPADIEEEVQIEVENTKNSFEQNGQLRSGKPRVLAEFTLVEKTLIERKVSEGVQASWLKAYPHPRWICQEILRAVVWEQANPTRRKKNFARFISGWLARAAPPAIRRDPIEIPVEPNDDAK